MCLFFQIIILVMIGCAYNFPQALPSGDRDASPESHRAAVKQSTDGTDKSSSEEDNSPKALPESPLANSNPHDRFKRASPRIFRGRFADEFPSFVGYQSNNDRFPTVA